MEVNVLTESNTRLNLLVKGVSASFLNALRRTVISRLPSLAIDEVTFYENTSPLFNEYIANRLALIPLSFEDGIAEDAKIVFELNAEAADEARVVYSRELASTDPVIKAFCEHVPIIKLGKKGPSEGTGQKLRLEATAVLGTARQHAKFQCALASYGALPVFKVSSNCNKCKECVKACPQQIISDAIKLTKPEKCVLCESCVEACKKNALSVKASKDEFTFFVESFNNLSARKQLERAINVLKEDAQKLSKQLR